MAKARNETSQRPADIARKRETPNRYGGDVAPHHGGGDRRPGGSATGRREGAQAFPPLSTSLEGFIKNGSDREFRQLIYSMLSFSTLMLRSREHFAAYIGVTGPQYSMMAVIAEAERATVGQIAQRMHVASPFVTAETGKLIRKNIVAKSRDEKDRRSVILTLTAKGNTLIRELAAMRRTTNDMMYRSLTGDRAKMLTEMMHALIADANLALHELDGPQWRGRKAPSA
jgi:DNA-binding MarR family transcriptional regulator